MMYISGRIRGRLVRVSCLITLEKLKAKGESFCTYSFIQSVIQNDSFVLCPRLHGPVQSPLATCAYLHFNVLM